MPYTSQFFALSLSIPGISCHPNYVGGSTDYHQGRNQHKAIGDTRRQRKKALKSSVAARSLPSWKLLEVLLRVLGSDVFLDRGINRRNVLEDAPADIINLLGLLNFKQ